MRKIRTPFLVLTFGLLGTLLVGCKKKTTTTKDPLVIPTVDVTTLNINLPALPTRNTGAINSDDDYEFIDMYELSDFHGAVSYESHSGGDYIGLPKLASYFENKREANPGGTIILSSGDMFQGSADSNLTRGYMVNYAMHYIGFDAMAVGNHEFDWGLDWLKKNAELTYNNYSIPFLGANIQKDGEILSFLSKSTIIERGEYKIGVIGVMGSDLESSVLKSALNGCEFVPYADIVSTESARLRSEGCQAVVLLAHAAADHIESVTGVDAVFGGHAHKDTNTTYAGVPALATLNYGQSVAHITFKFNKSTHNFAGVEVAPSIEPMRNVAGSLGENANVKSIMDQYAPEINKIKHIKLGTADAELKFDGALINICTDTMYNVAVNAVKANNPEIDPNKIVGAFHNVNGGIRDNIAAGEVTYGNVYKSFPFDNEIVLFKFKGSDARTKMTKLSNLGCYRLFENRNYFESTEEYYMVTTDYLAFSENGIQPFKELTDADLIRTGKVVRDEVANTVYQLDSLKNSELLHTGDFHYKKVSLTF